jgi:hypothetical protein
VVIKSDYCLQIIVILRELLSLCPSLRMAGKDSSEEESLLLNFFSGLIYCGAQGQSLQIHHLNDI